MKNPELPFILILGKHTMDLGMLATFIIRLTIVILKIGLFLRMVHTRNA
nr:unnamed protein product [Callosobruchus chinensis]